MADLTRNSFDSLQAYAIMGDRALSTLLATLKALRTCVERCAATTSHKEVLFRLTPPFKSCIICR
jgi:hypothetical protein